MVYYTVSGIRFRCFPSVYNNSKSQSSFSGDPLSRKGLSFFLKKEPSSLKMFAEKSSYDSDSPNIAVTTTTPTPSTTTKTTSEKVLVPLDGNTSEDSQVPHDVESLTMEDNQIVEEQEKQETSTPLSEPTIIGKSEAKSRLIPPPGSGQRIYEIDPSLTGFRQHLDYRYARYKTIRQEIDKYEGGLEVFSRGYEKLGFTCSETGITYREWAPGAKVCAGSILCHVVFSWAALIGDFNNWNPNADVMTRNEFGVWEVFLPNNADGSPPIPHGSRVKIRMDTPSGIKDSIPAWIKFSVQAPGEIPYNGVYYDPPEEKRPHMWLCEIQRESRSVYHARTTRANQVVSKQLIDQCQFANGQFKYPNNSAKSESVAEVIRNNQCSIKSENYIFKHPQPKRPKSLRIYEAHVGMSSTEPLINTYANFRDDVLPRIKRLGYNAVQIMAIQEHSYYASFGYHVTNFFAPSSRCGTPDDLKSLIDRAHELGLLVLMDIVHSHASNNTLDGLNMFDGTDSHYFHSGSRGHHWMWDSRLFNYGSWEVLRFLLSNARWWLDEYKFDGFRFDGVTSMMYTHHGLEVAFTGNYNEYFGYATDVDAMVYLMVVNDMIHGLFPEAVTIGEDVSGMPTFCIPVQDGGVGFDYRLHMAIADKWIDLLKKRDEDWRMGEIVHTLTNRRWMEKCVSYAESHDQALVGDKTIAFWLMDKDMYDFMALDRPSTPRIDRGIALHKMIRLITMGLGGEGYLNFMGNEFGHPEWIDFPRGKQHLPNGKIIAGNDNSFDKCRRRFDLGDADYLRYRGMQEFDQAMQHLEEIYGFMTSEHQYISRKSEGDRIIVFERGNLVFVFNFHWTNSYSDYRVGCLKPGKYKVVLDSDDPLFGGFKRLDHNAEYFSFDGWYDNRPHSFLVYAPSRTAVVYALVEDELEPAENEAESAAL
ncbi:unnamed protein product [Dovyalis caffra]|uniref:1,4-alpha-glucan-branching enzyme 1, chloroplastic/amyloplastic n=1 Tax=Dovyalis caffra TaxID=77055 RepID=A0AAV1RZR6_9ROSI|nr:unnamed protein product [Dovyalis caffra]